MTWQADMESASFLAAAASRVRTVRSRVELVNAADVVVAELPVTGGSVDYQGEQGETWAAEFTLADPALVPTEATDQLDPRAKLRARVWWGVLISGSWVEVPAGTFFLRQPRIVERVGSFQLSVTGRDALSEAKRGGYGTAAVKVGGLTVSAALAAIFARVAPWAPVRIAPSTVTLPAVYELTNDPGEDWDNIAALAGFVVRSDREGVIRCQPAPSPAGVRCDWQEGPECRVSEISREVDDDIINRVVVVGTNVDLATPIVGSAQIDDQGSPYWVGRFGPFETRIESDVVTTKAAADSMAKLHLGRLSHAQETVEVTIPQRGDLSYRDLVAVARKRVGASGLWRVSSWRLPLTAPNQPPAPMTVRMMTRQAVE